MTTIADRRGMMVPERLTLYRVVYLEQRNGRWSGMTKTAEVGGESADQVRERVEKWTPGQVPDVEAVEIVEIVPLKQITVL